MLFGLETVEIMAVAALTSRYVKSSNARLTYVPRYLWSDVYFRFVNCPLNLKRARFILAPRDSDNDFRIFQLSSTLSRLDPTLHVQYPLPFHEKPRNNDVRSLADSTLSRRISFLKGEGKKDNAKKIIRNIAGIAE